MEVVLDPGPAINEKQIRDRTKAFARRFAGNFLRNLFAKVLLWGAVFAAAALLYSRLIFSSGSMPEAFQTAGTVGILGIYLAAGLLAGLYFGTLAAVRGMSEDLSGVVGTVVEKGLVIALPADRERVSKEEVRRILDKVAPEGGGLSGFPLRLVRKKVLAEVTEGSDAMGTPSIRVADIRDYATGKLAGAVVGDIELKAKIGWIAGFIPVLVFLAGPLALMATL